MATEAEIIPEPISIVTAEDDQLKIFHSGFNQPLAETDERLAKIETNENGVEHLSAISQGNPGISTGESFFVSPEITKVAINNTSGMLEQYVVDDVPSKAQKMNLEEGDNVRDEIRSGLAVDDKISYKDEDAGVKSNNTKDEAYDEPKIINIGNDNDERIEKDDSVLPLQQLIEEEIVESSQDEEHKEAELKGDDEKGAERFENADRTDVIQAEENISITEQDEAKDIYESKTSIVEEDSELITPKNEPKEKLEESLSITSKSKADEIITINEEENGQNREGTIENKEKEKDEQDENNPKDNIENKDHRHDDGASEACKNTGSIVLAETKMDEMEVETLTKGDEIDSKEKAEPKNAVENIEDGLKQEEAEEKTEDHSKAENSFEVSIPATDKEDDQEKVESEPQIQVYKESETTMKENANKEELPIVDISDSSISEEAVNGSAKEDESSSMKLAEEATFANIGETAEPKNDLGLIVTEKELEEEIAPTEIKVDTVCSSSFKPEESREGAKEQNLVKGSTGIDDLETAPAAEKSEANIKEAEAEEKKHDIEDALAVEKNSLATNEDELISTEPADIDVKPMDSISYQESKEVPPDEDGLQDKIPNAGSEDQMDILLQEIPEEEAKEQPKTKGESFSISLETTKVASNNTSGISEHNFVDDVTSKTQNMNLEESDSVRDDTKSELTVQDSYKDEDADVKSKDTKDEAYDEPKITSTGNLNDNDEHTQKDDSMLPPQQLIEEEIVEEEELKEENTRECIKEEFQDDEKGAESFKKSDNAARTDVIQAEENASIIEQDETKESYENKTSIVEEKLSITSESKADEILSIKEEENVQNPEGTTENKEKVKGEQDDNSTKDNIENEDHRQDDGASEVCKNTGSIVLTETKVNDMEVETMTKGNEIDSEEKAEPENAVENIEDGLKQEEKTEDDSNAESNLELSIPAMDREDDKKNVEREPEIEVCKESETTVRETANKEEQPKVDISDSSTSKGTVNGSAKEDDSSSMKLAEHAIDSNIEETAEPKNDLGLIVTKKELKEEIATTEIKEDTVFSSSEESIKDNEEKTSVKGSSGTDDSKSAPAAEEANIKEAGSEEKEQEIENALAVEDNSLATDVDEQINMEAADFVVKPIDSISCEENKEIPQDEDGLQDKVPNAESEDQIELNTREIILQEIPEEEVKEHFNLPSEEHEPTHIEERKITDETSDKEQSLHEYSETPVSQATEEILKESEVPEVENEVNRKESGHDVKEHLVEAQEDTDVSKEEEIKETQNQNDSCDAKPLEEATTFGEISTVERKEKLKEEQDDNSTKDYIANEDHRQDDAASEACNNTGKIVLTETKVDEIEVEPMTKGEDRDSKENVEREPEIEVCKESEATEKENADKEERPIVDICDSSTSEGTVNGSAKEDESSPTKLAEEARDVNIEEITEPKNDSGPVVTEKELKEEIAPTEIKKESVCSSSFEPEESKEETSVKESTGTNDSEPAAAAEEANIKEAESEEKKHEIDNVPAVEKNSLATNEDEGISIETADIDVKPMDSISYQENKEILQDQDGYTVPNAGSEGQMEMSTRKILFQGITEEEVKEHFNLPTSTQKLLYESTHIEERKITDETSDKEQSLHEYSETPVSQATEEILKESEVPEVENEVNRRESGHDVKKHLVEAQEDTDVSKEEEIKETQNQNDSCDAKPLEEATTFGEISTVERKEKLKEEQDDKSTKDYIANEDHRQDDAASEACNNTGKIVLTETKVDEIEVEPMTKGEDRDSKENVEREPETEVCKKSETTEKENADKEEQPIVDISDSSTSEGTVNGSAKEDESSPTKLAEEARDVNIEEIAEPKNDSGPVVTEKELKEETAPTEIKEESVCSSSFEPEESQEETSVKESTGTNDSEPATAAEEANIKEAESEEKKHEIDNVPAVEKNSLATNEDEGISIETADIDVKPMDSISYQENKEIPQDQDGYMVPNAGSEGQMEMSTRKILFQGITEEEVKEHFNLPTSTQKLLCESTHIEERKITDETSDKEQSLHEYSETPVSQATEEILKENEVPKIEDKENGKESGHDVKEHLVEEPEGTDVSKEEETKETQKQNDVCELKTVQEQQSDLGLGKGKADDAKPFEEATPLSEISTTENKEKVKEEQDDNSTKDNIENKDHIQNNGASEACINAGSNVLTEIKVEELEVEPMTDRDEMDSKEKTEPKNVVENVGNSLKQEEAEEVCEESETTVKENADKEEQPIVELSNSSISEGTMDVSAKEDESSPMKLAEEAKDSNTEEIDLLKNDPSPLVTEKELKEEIAPTEIKEDTDCSSSFETKESKETLVKGIDTGDLESASAVKEANIMEDEAEEKMQETDNAPAVEKNSLETNEDEQMSTENADIDVKPMDSVSCQENTEITKDEDELHDNVPTAGSEDLMEMITRELLLQEIPEEEVREHPNLPSEEHEQLDEATDLGEISSTIKDGKKDIQEEENLSENLAKPESLKEDVEAEKEEAQLSSGVHDQMPEDANTNDNENVCRESETTASVADKENPDKEEQPIVDSSDSSIREGAVNGSAKEDEISTMKLEEEARISNIEETEELKNDPSPDVTEKELKEEIAPSEIKEDTVCSSSFKPEASKEETLVKGSIGTYDSEPASAVEETNIKEAGAEEKNQEIDNALTVEKDSLTTSEDEQISIETADIDVKPMDSISCQDSMEIPQDEDGLHDEVPNAGIEDQMELSTREILLQETPEEEVKEHSNLPSEEHEPTHIEERKITAETSEKEQTPHEYSETPAPQAEEEILMENEVPKIESEVNEKESGHEVEEHLFEVPEGTDISKEEETKETQNQNDACEAKTVQQSLDLELEKGKADDAKPLDEVSDLGDISSTSNDGKKDTQEEENLLENLAKPESSKEDAEAEKVEAQLSSGVHDQMPEDAKTCYNEKVCRESETTAFAASKENPDEEELSIVDISNSSVIEATVNESKNEDESSPLKLAEEPKNDLSLVVPVKELKEEVAPMEIKEETVCSSSMELKKYAKEETLVQGGTGSDDLDSTSAAAETEEINIKKAEAEEKKQEINNAFVVEKNSLPTTEDEQIRIETADTGVKPMESSMSCQENKEEEDQLQDNIPNAGNENQMEMTSREFVLQETLREEVKEDSNLPSEENQPTPIEETKITDKTSEKDQTPYEYSETPVSQAKDEILKENEENSTEDVPKVENEVNGKESGHVVNQTLAEESKGVDLGLEREIPSSIKDGIQDIQEQVHLSENLAKPESLKEDAEAEKEEAELPIEVHDQMHEDSNTNDNEQSVEQILESSEEKLKSDAEPTAQETMPEPSNSQADETSIHVQNQETGEQVQEEMDNKDYTNQEQDADEVTKAVILSEEVNKKVEKADDSEDIKENIIEEESSTKEQPVPKAIETTNEVEDYSLVKSECLKEAEPEEQKEAVVEEHSAKDRKAPLITEEPEVRGQKEDSGDCVNVQEEEKIVDISVKESRGETSLNNAKVHEEPVNKLSISSDKTSSETTESDANQEAQQVENKQLEEISSELEAEITKRDSDAGHVPKDLIDEALIEDDISSHSTLLKENPDEQLQMLQSTIPPEDKEISTAHSNEKTEEEIQKDAEIVKHESPESSSQTKTVEEVFLQKQGENEPNVISEGETIIDQGLQEEKSDEQVQNTSTIFLSKERGHGAEKTEDGKQIEEVPRKLYVGTKNEDEQTHSADRPEERTTNSALLEKEEEPISMVENTEEEKVNEAEILENKISDDSSDANKKEESSLEKEESQELEDAKKDDIASAQDLQDERGDGAGPLSEKIENAEMIEEEPKKPDVLTEDAITVEQTLSADKLEEGTASSALLSNEQDGETICIVENIEEEKVTEAEIPENKISNDSSDANKTEKTCLEKEESQEIPDAKKDDTASAQDLQEERGHGAGALSEKTKKAETTEEEPKKLDVLTEDAITVEQTLSADKPEEGTDGSELLFKEQDNETKSIVEKTEKEKVNEEEIPENKISYDSSDAKKTEETCLIQEEYTEHEDANKDETTVGQALHSEEPKEQSLTSSSTVPSENLEQGTTTYVHEVEEEKVKEVEILEKETSFVNEIPQEPEAVADRETIVDHTSIEEKAPQIEAIQDPVNEDNRIKEEEIENEDYDGVKTIKKKCFEKIETREFQAALEDETIASEVVEEESQEHEISREEESKKGETLEEDKSTQSECAIELQGASEDGAYVAQTLLEENQGEQLHVTTFTLPSEEQKDEKREKELQEDEINEKALLTETEDPTVKENLVEARKETRNEENQCEKTNEGNESILNEVSKEEVLEENQVAQTSSSTSLSEELKNGSGRDKLKDELVEEKLLVIPKEPRENENDETKIVCDEKTIEDPSQVSDARKEITTLQKEESVIELQEAEGNEIIDQPEEESAMQITREFNPIEITERMSASGEKDTLADLQEKVTESSHEAEGAEAKEVDPKVEVVEHEGEKTTTNVHEVEEEKVKEVEIPEKETCFENDLPQEPEAVVDQETAGDHTSIAEKAPEIEIISTVKKLDEEKRKEDEKLESENVEDSSARETEEILLRKEESSEVHAVQTEEISSGETFSKEQSDEKLCISNSAATSEELEHAIKNKEETMKDETTEDASDARTIEEVCSQKEKSINLEAVVDDKTTVAQALTENRSEEEAENPTVLSKAEECESTCTGEKTESKATELLQDENGEEVCLQKEQFQEDETPTKDENASAQVISTKKTEEKVSEKHKQKTDNEDNKIKEEVIENEDSDGDKRIQETCSEKNDTREFQAVLEHETIATEVIVEESQSEPTGELQGASEDGVHAAQTLLGENQGDQLHVITSTLPSEEQKYETDLQEDENTEKIPEQTREVDEASNVNVETSEKVLLTETEDLAVKENLIKARDETRDEENQCEKTKEGNESIYEVSNEEVLEANQFTQTSSTSLSEELKNGSGRDELKDEPVEEKLVEKKIVCEDKTVEDPDQASSARKETIILKEEESSIELPEAEGKKIINQPEEESATQIPREFNPIDITERMNSSGEKDTVSDLQGRVGECSHEAEQEDAKEIDPKVELVEHEGVKTTDKGEEIAKESMSLENLNKVSSALGHVENSTKETLEMVAPDIIEEREEKNETGAAQNILVEEPEEESPAQEINAVQPPATELKEKELSETPVSHSENVHKEDEDIGDNTEQTLKTKAYDCQTDSQEHGISREEENIKRETQEGDKITLSEPAGELQSASKDGAPAAQTLLGENEGDQLHVTASTLPSEEQKDGTELQEHENKEKIPEQTREVEEASSVKTETSEKVLLTETEDLAIKENIIKAREETKDEENQFEKTNEGYVSILTEVSMEEVLEEKQVTQTSFSTSMTEEPKSGSGEDDLKDELLEEKLLVKSQEPSEIEIAEQKIVCEDRTVEHTSKVSDATKETTTLTKQESSIELPEAEGNEIIDQPVEESATQIPREFNPIEITEKMNLSGEKNTLADLQERVAESSHEAEEADAKDIDTKVELVEHEGEKTIVKGEEIVNESMPEEDLTKVSSSDHVESSTKETLEMAVGDITEKREAKDEIGAAQKILVEKPEEESPAHEIKAVQPQATELKEKELSETPTSHSEQVHKEDEDNIGDKTEQTLKASAYETQTEEVSIPAQQLWVETQRYGASDNAEKEVAAEDKTTVKDLEQPSVGMKDAITVKEEILGEAHPTESTRTSSTEVEHFQTKMQGIALETSYKAEVRDSEPGNTPEVHSEAGVDHREEKEAYNSGVEITKEPQSADSTKLSLSDILQGEKVQVAKDGIEDRELIENKEKPEVAEAETIQVKEEKTDEEKEGGEEGDEHNKSDSGSDAIVMVEAPRDADAKPHKKSHNILSGVSSKVKHSISKVKKAIIGKSSNSKEAKSISPKGGEKS